MALLRVVVALCALCAAVAIGTSQQPNKPISTAARLGYTETALDEYVAKPDPTYTWEDTGLRLNGTVRTLRGGEPWTGYILNMTSQTWLTPEDSSRSVWWHMMAVIVPDGLEANAASSDWSFLWITGGDNEGDPVPSATDEEVISCARLAVQMGVVTVALFQVPNQHIVFAEDPIQKARSEDAIIAYTWDHFVKHPDEPEWLLRLPMTKAAIRAMDTAEAFLAGGGADRGEEREPYRADVVNWGVAGASKRGWTTWTTAAVAPDRVKAIAPIVLDMLNFIENIHHQYRAYGGWTFALEDYYDMNFTANLDNPNTQKLAEIVDPYYYFDRLTMPKMACNSGWDEFLMPDDTHWWWDDMPEPKHFLMMPNTEHSCATGILELVPAIGAFMTTVIEGEAAPEFTWSIDTTGTGDITVDVADTDPHSVVMWSATTCNGDRRDFRVVNLDDPCTCGLSVQGQCVNLKVWWTKTELTEEPDRPGIYVAHQDEPEEGWTAFFVDVQYDTRRSELSEADPAPLGWPIDWPQRLEFTSEVSIVPNTFPFEDCHGADCQGTLV